VNDLVPAIVMPSLLIEVTLLVTVRKIAVFASPPVMLTVDGTPEPGVESVTVNVKPCASYFGLTWIVGSVKRVALAADLIVTV
jgi:hypothetical protein